MVIAAPALNFKPKQATLPVQSFLQRLLLISNDKISDIVNAYSQEAIETVKLHQKLVTYNSSLDPLYLNWEQELIESSVVLRGKDSQTNYIQINSYSILERLDAMIRDRFIFDGRAIAQILEDNKVKTYREIIDCGLEPTGNLAELFAIQADTKIIYRTYLVVIDSLSAIQVTEKFPICHFID